MKKVFYIIITFMFVADRYFKDFSSLPKTINSNFSFNLTFSIFPLLLMLFLLPFVIRHLSLKKENISFPILLFILGGLSNIIDRFIYGGVVDYLNLFGILKNNLSDYLIFLGVIFYVYAFFKNKDPL